MWGSDWSPVAGREGYGNALRPTIDEFAKYPERDRELIFGGNAERLFRYVQANNRQRARLAREAWRESLLPFHGGIEGGAFSPRFTDLAGWWWLAEPPLNPPVIRGETHW